MVVKKGEYEWFEKKIPYICNCISYFIHLSSKNCNNDCILPLYKTQRTKPPISSFTAVARLRSQSETVAQVLILSTKSAKGCKGAEWIVNFWLAKMDAQWLLLIRLMKYVMLLNFICLFNAFWRFCCVLLFMFVKTLVLTIK